MSCNREQAIVNFGKYATKGSKLSAEHKESISEGINTSKKYMASYADRVTKIRAWHVANKGAWKGQKKKRTAEHNAKIGASQIGRQFSDT